MTFVPFARKYRPQTFADLIGQPHVTDTLTRALQQQRITQAYLFAGQRGVGKTSAARILAKCFNCEQGPTPSPCQTCVNCRAITQGNSLDVTEIDGASNRGIDEIRRLRESVPFAPTSGPFHVYIIDEVHMLTPEAFNALLKTLEEPPAHAKFVFATTAPTKVPATVLSRCQRFDFRRVEVPTIVQALGRIAKAERLAIDEPALYAIARAADGSLRDAEVVLEQLASFAAGSIREPDVTALLGLVESEALAAWSRAILARDAQQALTLLAQQVDQGREPLQLLGGLLRHVRNLLLVASHGGAGAADALVRLVDEPPERLEALRAQAAQSSPQELLMLLQVLANAYETVRRSPMAQTILELVVVRLATREQWQSLDEISRRLEQLSGGRAAAAPAALPSQTASPAPQPLPARSAAVERPAPAARAPVIREESRAAEGPVTIDALRALWPEFLQRLGEQKMSLAAYLAESRPQHVDGAVLTVGLPGFSLHQEVLTVLESRRLIERLLGELAGATLTVQYATLPEPVETPEPADASPGGAGAPPIVQDIVKLFNATILPPPRMR